ncbi:MAG: right-handed parallel beta-helix repeat-containing protein [Bacteroidales bacterium]|jgi:parallel beta-helix repeat protein|nr:right-handed parallel beta-helix repeat-containing protein [Bacteroidales bacterium]
MHINRIVSSINLLKGKKVSYTMMLLFIALSATSKIVYIATDGNDSNPGTITSPYATLNKAQSVVAAGDTVYFRGGTYSVSESQIMEISGIFARVFKLDKSGNAAQRICYFGYPGERPVFDLTAVKPADKRVYVFFVSGSYLHFRNFEVVGTQVTITEHTQSECFHHEGGNNCIYENLAMHDGMAVGFYITKGSNNLILNCDAYNNWDNVSEDKKGGNTDGFGGHVNNAMYTGNVFRGCRAWYNSDDGFDLINCFAPFVIENCWAFKNGYSPAGENLANGAGFKSGGYGMSGYSSAHRPFLPCRREQKSRLLRESSFRRFRFYQQYCLPQSF